MCEAKVYLSRGEGEADEEKILEDVVLIQPEGDVYRLVTLLGEQKLVRGHIEKIDFLRHTVHLSAKEAGT